MTDIILYDYWRSSASYRVRIALNLKGIAYKSVTKNLLDDSTKQADYIARNPQGFIPMLHIDGHDLTQSLAIIDYLDATVPEPPMVSSDPLERSRTLAQALVVAADIHPVNNLRIMKYLKNEMGQDKEAINIWYRNWVSEGFKALEVMAPESGFFGGDAPNLADVCLVPQMYNGRRFETDMTAFPKLVRIDAACNELAAFHNAAPEQVKTV
ncbi:maleylacetoacetate isomerase [Sphingorhabdus sp. EL138]|uniref:maleylacetoacetate isomerase n=1 Tax=Sphingorhabdus sp. EL138 TaxID=2073156 RepID=UPI000D699939|nr:maleylacetoacetate isomerase [Sphingorhabdus sp. EL138]